jgi:hypothetical protein
MTCKTRHIRFFVIMILFFNSMIMLSSDRMPTPRRSVKASQLDFSKWKNIFFGSTTGFSAVFRVLGKSPFKIGETFTCASDFVANHPQQSCGAAVVGLMLAVLLYKQQSIKNVCNSDFIEKGKQKIDGVATSLGDVLDRLIAKCPYIFQPLPRVVKGFVAWFYRKLIAMENEYAIGALVSPGILYLNSLTPFSPLGGIKTGFLLAGVFVARGWMGIDSAEIKKDVNKVSKQVEVVDKKVDRLGEVVDQVDKNVIKVDIKADAIKEDTQQIKATLEQQHEKVLADITAVNKNIADLSQSLTERINDGNNQLSTQITNEAQISRNILQEKIEEVNKQLAKIVDDVSELPSKDDSVKIIDAAMTETIKKLQQFVADSVKAVDNSTENKFAEIKKEMEKSFADIDSKQDVQNNAIKDLAQKVSRVIDEREEDIAVLADLVGSTKLSNQELLKKFAFMDSGFESIKAIVEDGEIKYKKLLEEKKEDWGRLQKKMDEQINIFSDMNIKINNMDQKIANLGTKVEKNYELLSTQMNEQSQQFQEILNKEFKQWQQNFDQAQKEAEREREKAAERELELKKELLKLREDLKMTAIDINKKQDKILDAINNKTDDDTDKITFNEKTEQFIKKSGSSAQNKRKSRYNLNAENLW